MDRPPPLVYDRDFPAPPLGPASLTRVKRAVARWQTGKGVFEYLTPDEFRCFLAHADATDALTKVARQFATARKQFEDSIFGYGRFNPVTNTSEIELVVRYCY